MGEQGLEAVIFLGPLLLGIGLLIWAAFSKGPRRWVFLFVGVGFLVLFALLLWLVAHV